METNSDTTKILGKGPEYLRKQMELENETKAGMSAVERLAASKPKYVKSQQVVSSTQEPVISVGSASVSSIGSSSGICVSTDYTSVAQDCSQVRRSSSKKRPDSLLLYRQKCELLKASANERKHHITRKVLLSSVNKNVPLPEATEKECESEVSKEKITTPEGRTSECGSRVVTTQIEKRSNGVTEASTTKSSNSGAQPTAGGLLAVPELQTRSGKGVSRSHSDISSRYSKNFADFDAFFKYCGLDGEVIESLGKENFSAHSDEIAINIRSVSISTSDDGFSRDSGDSNGLLEDELQKTICQGPSVIERNARIIKWLYSCKNATETGKKLRALD
ncbi:protein FAM110C [Melanotaenia boesemani]|uniref:protein FAM110C n=1 Tax=Melanotaenia boesemani TaxID=1250792 RepID=UPI001C056CAF|nr:protein FAM110C [Melanotaenia boesemani]